MPTSPPLSTPSNHLTQPNFNSNLSFISITTSNCQNVTYISLPPLTNTTHNPKSENEKSPRRPLHPLSLHQATNPHNQISTQIYHSYPSRPQTAKMSLTSHYHHSLTPPVTLSLKTKNLPDAHFTPSLCTKQPTHTTKFQLKSIIHIHHDLKPPKCHLQLTTTTNEPRP